MKRLLLIIIVTITSISLSLAQTINGKVTDKEGVALSYATITLLEERDSTTVVAYDLTDENGRYNISSPKKGDFILKASYLGFSEELKRVALQSDSSDIDFILEEGSLMLSDITVKGRQTGVIYSQDTVRYDVKHFADGSEEVLGDLLKKMPGIEVDEKGSVRAQGKDVGKILLDGQDFFGSSTQMATKNLPAEYAETIEVLSDYSEYSLLKGFQSHKQTVLNVGVKKDKIGRLSGSLEAGGGFRDKYEVKGDLLLIRPKSMFSLIESVNNSGREVFTVEEYIRLQGGLAEMAGDDQVGSSSFELSEEEKRVFVPRNDVFKRQNGITAINTALQPNSKLKINSYFLFNHNDENFESFNRYNYNTSQLDGLTSDERNDGKLKNRLYNGFLKIDYTLTPSATFSYKGSLVHTNNSSNENIFQRTIDESLSALEDNRSRVNRTDHRLLFLKTHRENLFAVSATYSYVNKHGDYALSTDSLLLPLEYREEEDLFLLNQRIGRKQEEASVNLSHTYKINEELLFKTSFLGNWLSESFDNSILREIQTEKYNVLRNTFIKSSPIVSFIRQKGLLRFNLGMAYSFYRYNSMSVGDYRKNISELNPHANISFHFSQRHALQLKISQTNDPLNIESYTSGVIINNFQSYLLGNQMTKRLNRQLKSSFIYYFFDQFSNTTLFVLGGYNRVKHGQTRNYEREGIVSTINHIPSKPSEIAYLNLNLSKGLGFIPWTFKLISGLRHNEISNEQNSIFNSVKLFNWANEIQLLSTYRKRVLNYEVRYKVDYLETKGDLVHKTTQTIHRLAAKVKLTPGTKVYADLEFEYLKNRLSQFGTKHNYFLNASVKYKLNDRVEFQLSGYNVFNINKQRWYAKSYQQDYILERSYRQIPGNVLLGFKVRF